MNIFIFHWVCYLKKIMEHSNHCAVVGYLTVYKCLKLWLYQVYSMSDVVEFHSALPWRFEASVKKYISWSWNEKLSLHLLLTPRSYWNFCRGILLVLFPSLFYAGGDAGNYVGCTFCCSQWIAEVSGCRLLKIRDKRHLY